MNKPGKPRHGPDRSAALAQYRRRAGFYDLELALFEPAGTRRSRDSRFGAEMSCWTWVAARA